MNDGPSRGDEIRMRIFRRIIDSDGVILHNQWVWSRGAGEPVGRCVCNGDLMPSHPVPVNDRRTDYEAWCPNCGRTVLAPFGKTLKRKEK